MSNVQIKKIDKHDLSQLEKVYISTIKQEFPEYSHNISNHFISDKYKTYMFEHEYLLGAYVDTNLVGYLIAGKEFGGVIFISWIAVLHDFQGKGIGYMLLQELEKIAIEKGVHALQLEADKRNIAYYEKHGWKVFGQNKNGYFGLENYHLQKDIQMPLEENYLR